MAKVTAYVYDITQGMAAQMSVALVGKKIDYIPHTGIAVFGKEYFFGGGPQVGIPGQSVPVPVTQVLELGETQKTCEELEAYIRNVLSLEHNEQNYDLLRHNCNHYADDVAKFLLDGTGLPTSIVNVAEEALSTPQGQALKVMIENMERSMRSGGNSSSLNPFSNVGASPAVVAEAGDEWHGDLKAALADLAKNEQEVRRTALQMLLKMTENVEKIPSEQKFRRIKMSNPAFQKKVEAAGGGVEVMLAAGWLPDTMPEGEDCWLLNDAAVQRQASVRKTLESELAKLPAAPAPVPAPTPAAQPAGYGGGLPAGLPDLPGGLGGPGGNAMMQQAQQMMMNNPGMMQQAQQMMQDPNMMAQVQQMMQNPQAMAQLQQMMGGMGR